MKSMLKCTVMSFALVLPFLGACDAPPDATTVNGSPDPTKPSIPETSTEGLKPSLKAAGYVVNPSFTGPILASNGNTIGLGANTTLSVSTNMDVGPTPYYIEIFDATTSTRVGVCGSGTSCSATVSQSQATTHTYVAYVSGYSAAMPPANTVATSQKSFVTWTSTTYLVSLPTATGCIASGSATIVATSNVDVGPTPYYIQIFDTYSSRLVGSCGAGTTCLGTYQCGSIGLTAFISSYSTAIPPSNTQSSSNTVIPTVSVQ
jgi:hypothetical protein